LIGGNGSDSLVGDAGNDTLFGGRGNDRLYGGAGDDTLTGGKDRDTFIFAGDGGSDTITDFRNGEDRIQIVTETPAVIADLIAGAEQDGENVIIHISDTETVTLQHFSLSNLDAKDFLV
jgi:Ca2+-binding RTX toxin-like protein